MCVGIDAAMKCKPKPDAIVVFTDGYTPWPEQPVGAKIIAVLVEEGPNPPDFIRTIRVN